ncbi:MAG: CDP-diacylglycerol--glycerol-3-phosphate 3-phosphatidyltransferase [Gammaproteobacteria bacterium]|nr:MAG: CDP-diacylglycerol--glycerol-3-phosphate 3-phosphatidyltransferase [Gammaproteobacteria bacterium]
MYTLPTYLTLLRIGLIPVMVFVFFLPFTWSRILCAWIFLVAALTDWLDGYLARKLDQESRFGAFLDPVADKLMVVSALLLLVYADASILVTISAIIITGREITISALREWMAEVGAGASVAVNRLGKTKTLSQMGAIFFMLYQRPFYGVPMYQIGLVLLYIAAILTLWSMLNYIKAARQRLKDQ